MRLCRRRVAMTASVLQRRSTVLHILTGLPDPSNSRPACRRMATRDEAPCARPRGHAAPRRLGAAAVVRRGNVADVLATPGRGSAAAWSSRRLLPLPGLRFGLLQGRQRVARRRGQPLGVLGTRACLRRSRRVVMHACCNRSGPLRRGCIRFRQAGAASDARAASACRRRLRRTHRAADARHRCPPGPTCVRLPSGTAHPRLHAVTYAVPMRASAIRSLESQATACILSSTSAPACSR